VTLADEATQATEWRVSGNSTNRLVFVVKLRYDVGNALSDIARKLYQKYLESFEICAGEEWRRSVGPIV
jgi:hypothetical protein